MCHLIALLSWLDDLCEFQFMLTFEWKYDIGCCKYTVKLLEEKEDSDFFVLKFLFGVIYQFWKYVGKVLCLYL